MNRRVRHVGCVFRGAHASRVLANASSRSRTFHCDFDRWQALHEQRLFRRDAKTSTRDACATHASNFGSGSTIAVHSILTLVILFRISAYNTPASLKLK